MTALRHMDPYALDLRRQQIEREHEEVLQELQRRAAAEPPAGLTREPTRWTQEQVSTLRLGA